MAEATQSLTRQSAAGAGDARRPGQGRIGALLTDYLGDRAFRQLGLILGLAAAIAAGVGLYQWAQKPMMRDLFANLPNEDAAQVTDALRSANIDFRTDSTTGAIMVPADQLDHARLLLAEQGLPNTGGVGFESLRKDQGFGTSRFMETARFNRALETEISRTVTSLQAVKGARVHLAIPERSAFIRDRRKPSASVAVGLFPGRSLTSGQVTAITHMVASAVPNLATEDVTVVDQRGELLTSDGGDDNKDISTDQLDYQHRLEQSYVDRIKTLLAPIVGPDHVRAQVNARLDFAQSEQTQELYDPDKTALRSEQTSEQRSDRGNEATGIPGALSNQPPAGGQLAPAKTGGNAQAATGQGANGQGNTGQGANGNANGGGGNGKPQVIDQSVNKTRNYEVSKTVRHVRSPRGEIQRLSVAVLLDKPAAAPAGNAQSQGGNAQPQGKAAANAGLSQQQLDQIQSLVKQAVGFDATRGDTVDVVTAPFQPKPAEPRAAPTPIWQQPWVMELGKALLAGILGLVLILAVLRPLVNALLGRDRRERPATSPGTESSPQALAGEEGPRQLTAPGQEGGGGQQGARQIGSGGDYEDNLNTARGVAGQDPALAANVVKSWLAQEQ
ncbi:MAG TPA: flagellar basal-body MS-ring/collar protein FliF [Gammaproteobacteria bacterium]|nr:flagellar basal-body MS-ring/collar protein FliF [Gammaproteobacteria bacterium]